MTDIIPQIGFIGAGKVGCSLGRYFISNGYTVSGYYSRTSESALAAAKLTDTAHFNDLSHLIEESNIIFITVTDSAIEKVWNQISDFDISGKIICHTSGALSSRIFSDIAGRSAYGYSLHPILAISNKCCDLTKAHFTLEGDDHYKDFMFSIITNMGNPVTIITDENKVLYHASAVFASNLVCGVFHKACSLLQECGFTEQDAFSALSSLFYGNASNISANGPVSALTGPVERGDVSTISKHLSVLSEKDRLLYSLLSENVLEIARKKNPSKDYDELNSLLLQSSGMEN